MTGQSTNTWAMGLWPPSGRPIGVSTTLQTHWPALAAFWKMRPSGTKLVQLLRRKYRSGLLWVLADNPARFFYQTVSGKLIGRHEEPQSEDHEAMP